MSRGRFLKIGGGGDDEFEGRVVDVGIKREMTDSLSKTLTVRTTAAARRNI